MAQTPNQRGPASNGTQMASGEWCTADCVQHFSVYGECRGKSVARGWHVSSQLLRIPGGCVAKTRRGTHWSGDSSFLLGLGHHPNEAAFLSTLITRGVDFVVMGAAQPEVGRSAPRPDVL